MPGLGKEQPRVEREQVDRQLVASDQIDEHAPFGPESGGERDATVEAGRGPAERLHRLGGLEKEEVTGNVSYDPDNHQLMTDTRAWKIANIANDIPDLEVDDPDGADVLVLSWGSSYSATRAGVGRVRAAGKKAAVLTVSNIKWRRDFECGIGRLQIAFFVSMINRTTTLPPRSWL